MNKAAIQNVHLFIFGITSVPCAARGRQALVTPLKLKQQVDAAVLETLVTMSVSVHHPERCVVALVLSVMQEPVSEESFVAA